MTITTREKLAWAAAKLFQEKGFHGVGLSEILTATGLPKGSLYHHFPDGKVDLALEAAAFTNREMLRIIHASFAAARDFEHGACTLLFKLARMFELMGNYTGCPVNAILFAGPDYEDFRAKSAEYFEAWIAAVAGHAERLGLATDVARIEAEKTFHVMQGAWTLARAQADSDVMRDLARRMWPAGLDAA